MSREDTTHMRVRIESLEKLRLIAKVEGLDMTMIFDQMVNKREKDLHGGNVSSRARDLGVG